MKCLVIVFAFLVLFEQKSQANWSMNLGYNNPPSATVGLNLMNIWTNWAFELGLGSAKVEDKNDSNIDVTVLTGDVDFKYLFSNGGFRPYLQVGTAYAIGAKDNAASLGVGGSGYGGLGFFAMGSRFYAYASYNTGSFIQFGLGMDI